MHTDSSKPSFIQHKLRAEVKQWIEREARALERSQAWFLNKLIEDAFAAANRKQGVAA